MNNSTEQLLVPARKQKANTKKKERVKNLTKLLLNATNPSWSARKRSARVFAVIKYD